MHPKGGGLDCAGGSGVSEMAMEPAAVTAEKAVASLPASRYLSGRGEEGEGCELGSAQHHMLQLEGTTAFFKERLQ